MGGATWDEWIVGLPLLVLLGYLVWRAGQRWMARGWRERGEQFEKGREDARRDERR